MQKEKNLCILLHVETKKSVAYQRKKRNAKYRVLYAKRKNIKKKISANKTNQLSI